MESQLAPRPLGSDRRRRAVAALVVLLALALLITVLLALSGTVFADPMTGT